MGNQLVDTMLSGFQDSMPSPERLTEIVSWVKHADTEDILYLLRHIPFTPRALLYERLFETIEGNPPWLDAALAFILTHPNRHGLDKHLNHHLQALTKFVLLSAATCSEQQIKSLAVMISTEHLADLSLQLRAIASTYGSQNMNQENSRFHVNRQTYLKKYDTLLVALTVRATTAPLDYQRLVASNSELANLLMAKRIKAPTSAQTKKELAKESLAQIHQFNWEDKPFRDLLNNHLAQVFSDLPLDELKACFNTYADFHNNRNPNEVIRFLDLVFAASHSVEKVLYLIQDNAIAINFITQSRSRNPELTEGLFNRLDEPQLIRLCGHVIALQKNLQQEGESLVTIYCRVLCEKIRNNTLHNKEILNVWAHTLTELPLEVQEEQIATAFYHLNPNTDLQLTWIKALLTTPCDKSLLFKPCQLLLKSLPVPEQAILLGLFPSEMLPDLYLFMLQNRASDLASVMSLPSTSRGLTAGSSHSEESKTVDQNRATISDFNGFLALFSDTSKQDILLNFIHNSPLSDQAFLAKLLPLVKENSITSLLEALIHKAELNTHYKPILDQVLTYFCHQLLAQNWNKTHFIHTWVQSDCAAQIAEHILGNPECFAPLTSRTTNLFQRLLVYGPEVDLKMRIIQVLNHAKLSDDKANKVALRLLSHFRMKPYELQTLFVNLQGARSSLDDNGQTNYQRLIRDCWLILNPEKPESSYQEERGTALLTSGLVAPNCFEGVLTLLVRNLCQEGDAYQGAHYLVQIQKNDMIEQIDPKILASILWHSVQDTTLGNWSKLSNFLTAQSLDKNLELVKALIRTANSQPPNQTLIEKSSLFIQELTHFNELLPSLDDQELQWLVQTCSAERLQTLFPLWLDILISRGQLQKLDRAALFASLPPLPSFLSKLYQRQDLQPYLQELFICFARMTPMTTPTSVPDSCHFINLYFPISTWPDEAKCQFLKAVHKEINPKQMVSVAALVLNTLVLSLSDWQRNRPDDLEMICEHLSFLIELIENYPEESEQLLLNTFSKLSLDDPFWIPTLLNNQTFAKALSSLMKRIDEPSIANHPLAALLIENVSATLHPSLVTSKAYQRFVSLLLSNPPDMMQDDQFMLLFASLGVDQQRALAQDILSRPSIEDVQWFSLITLSRALSVKTLYQIFCVSKTRFVFVDLIFRHPDVVDQLTRSERNNVIDNLISAKQVQRILDSQCPITTKCHFVQSIFQYLKDTHTDLSDWLSKMNMDSQALAVLANFTTIPEHQHLLQMDLRANPYRMRSIQDYLLAPDLDRLINPQSLLHSLIKNAWLNPQLGWQCHPSLLTTLDIDSAQESLRAQYHHLTQLQQLESFYAPMMHSQETTKEIVISAHWIQCLPLFSQGLLEIIQELASTKCAQTKKTIVESRLYREIILPLLQTDNHGSDTLPTKLVTQFIPLFDEYLAAIQSINPDHYELVNYAKQNFSQQIKAIQHASPPKLQQYFIPGSRFFNRQNDVSSQIHSDDREYLAQALIHHNQCVETQRIHPSLRLQDILASAANIPQLLSQSVVSYWLLQTTLYSPLTQSLPNPLLVKILSSIPLTQLIKQVEKTHERLQQYEGVFTRLKSMTEIPLVTLVDSIWNLPDEEQSLWVEATRFAQLPYLSSLIMLVSRAKQANLSFNALQRMFPSTSDFHNQEFEWIKPELNQIGVRQSVLTSRCTELMTEALRYRNDGIDSERLIKLPKQRSNCDLPSCLNSYLPIFLTNQHELADSFLQLLLQLLSFPNSATLLIRTLDRTLIRNVLTFALQDPTKYEDLLLRMIPLDFNRTFETLIQAQLQKHFFTIVANPSTPPDSLVNLTPEQVASLPKSSLEPILVMQRLLYHVTPIHELADWNAHGSEMSNSQRSFFCADASLLSDLTQLVTACTLAYPDVAAQQHVLDSLTQCFTFIKERANDNYYKNAGRTLTSNQPAAYFYYLNLMVLIYDDSDLLLESFRCWLQSIENPQLDNPLYLEKLLILLIEKNLLTSLCQHLQKKSSLSQSQAEWLFATSLRLHPLDEARIPDLIRKLILTGTWSWLAQQIRTSIPNRFNLLHAALENENHTHSILANEQSISDFLALLSHCHLPPNDVIQLFHLSKHPVLRSLLATHLIKRSDYLSHLGGHSMLSQLATPYRIERRLKPISHHLDLASLPISALQQWPEESAAELLCSVKQFHLLNQERMLPLLQAIPSRGVFLGYWLKHYAWMPNGDKPLFVIANHYPQYILKTLPQVQCDQQEAITHNLIKQCHQLTCFTPDFLTNFCDQCGESELNFALLLYRNGRQQDAALVAIIHTLVRALVKREDTDLSSTTIKHLVLLSEDNQFSQLQEIVGDVTGNYLRLAASEGDCSIFYDNGQINLARMSRTIPLKFTSAPDKPSQGLFHKVASVFRTSVPIEEDKDSSSDEFLKNSLLNRLAQQTANLSAISYFLIHFRGDTDALSRCLHDYFNGLALDEAQTENVKHLNVMSWLMKQPETPMTIRTTIYDNIINHPDALNSDVVADVLQFDADTFLMALGKSKQYQRLIDLTSLALPKLSNYPDIVEVANRAMEEAVFEQSLQDISGFFAGLRIWFKRCVQYGWSGFFNPMAPTFVASFDSPLPVEPVHSTQQVLATLRRRTPSPRPQLILANLLPTIRVDSSLSDLNECHKALITYDCQEHNLDEEQALREAVDKLFNGLLQRTQTSEEEDDSEFERWFIYSKEAFINNRRRLIGLYCQTNQDETLNHLLDIAYQGPGAFNDIAEELQESRSLESPVLEELSQPQPGMATKVVGGVYQVIKTTLSAPITAVYSLGTYLWPTTKPVAASSSAPPSQKGWFG